MSSTSTTTLTLTTVESPQHPGATVTWCVHEVPQVVSVDAGSTGADPKEVIEATRALVGGVKRRGGRPPRLGVEHYEGLAEQYRALVADPDTRAPLKVLAAQRGVSYTNMARWVGTCRRLGLL